MTTQLLKSKAFKALLASDFALPKSSACGWFFEDGQERDEDYRAAVRSFCGLGATAFALLSEAVEHQEITRKNVSKLMETVEGEGLIIVMEGDSFLEVPARVRPSLLGEDVLLAVDDLLDALQPAAAPVPTMDSKTALSPSM